MRPALFRDCDSSMARTLERYYKCSYGTHEVKQPLKDTQVNILKLNLIYCN